MSQFRIPPQLFVLLAVGGSACADTSSPGEQPRNDIPDALQRATPNVKSLGLDGEFAALAGEIPGFGGLFFDESGSVMHVYLTNTANKLKATPAIQAFLRARPHVAFSKIEFQPGEYDFRQLLAWKDQAGGVLDLPGAVFLDVDEVRNRLRIGIESAAATEPVLQAVAGLGIPRQAVLIEQTEPPEFASTLSDRIRPTLGGLKITNGSNGVCTMGYNVLQGGRRGFLINSHCTNVQGGTEGTTFSQPVFSFTNLLGEEVLDPAYFACTSPTGGQRKCRYSDAALAYTYDYVSSKFEVAYACCGGTTITTRFAVIGKGPAPVINQFLQKTGYRTGTTGGPVVVTCGNYDVGATFRLLCQSVVNAKVDLGDSGSPVGYFNGGSASGQATLYGLLWGRNPSNTQFFFSQIGYIDAELGNLQVTP